MALYNAPTKLFIDYNIDELGKIIKDYGFKNILFIWLHCAGS